MAMLFLVKVVCMREEYNSILSTPTEADDKIDIGKIQISVR